MTQPPEPRTPAGRWSYFGPAGTFTEQALRTLPEAASVEAVPCTTVTVALDEVRAGESDAAVVPIENSVEGSVPVTLDELATGEPLMIRREMTVPVAFSLLTRPGHRLEDVRVVGTHPHAEAQTRGWVARHLPGATVVHATSTAAAAAALADPDATPLWDAAISAPLAAERYGLEALATGIGDNAEAVTRFVLVTRPGRPSPPTGRDKTSLVLFMRENHPGALLEILDQLATRGVDLTRIESRPTGHALGDYCFSVDAEGHIEDRRLGEALMGLRRICADVRFLGSYERHDGKAATIRPGTTDEEFNRATAWLARLRDGA
ncbi:prephenate dehydratase [Nocardioides marmoribigeumensis]|uniref:Prephenate dehydratase n=1 Tax=Nocardioides marmoribigeumensis TaxID=433649 RepID=A0ABU2BUA5_9ACTN|nr:prephenate dehydratase [Nocardioides marmoribigeumensis]MDR7362212.1 prephenate dehydratase [Nocardioides marmoribigeumensis]